MSEINKFRDDWEEFYLALDGVQQAHFLCLMDKHCNYQLNDVINELEDMKVIV